jgi:hypothetical protein
MLFKKCFETGLMPQMWGKSILNPIPKPGKDSRIPTNTQPISLISTVCKIYSFIINKRITSFLEDNNVLHDEQNGFRALRSCMDHLYVLSAVVKHRLSKKLPTYGCFVDFTKAFDSITHDLLWLKLIQYGVDGKILRTIKQMYAHSYSAVRLNGYMTDWFKTSLGVRQGDTLSTTLFSVYVNDLIYEIKSENHGVKYGELNVSILCYADDIILLSETEDGLQSMLNTLHSWCVKWRLTVNKNKTQIIHFRKQNSPETNVSFKYGETLLNKVNQYRYLGLNLDYCMNYNTTVQTVVNASSRALGMLTSKYFALNGLHHDTYKKLYDTTVIPVMSYGACIWGVKRYSKCDTLQHRCIRTFLGVGKPTPIAGLYGEIGWIPPYVHHSLEVTRLWLRMNKMADDRLTKKVFNIDKSIGGYYSWASSAARLLGKCGVYPQDYDNEEHVKSKVQNTLIDEFVSKWSEEIPSISRLELYPNIKHSYGTEGYVKTVLNRKTRSLICKLRCGTLPILIETGRYRNIPRDQRICRYCSSKDVEDSIHVLFKCSLYNDERRDFLHNVNLHSNDHHAMLYELLNDEDLTVKTGQYISKLLLKRARTV